MFFILGGFSYLLNDGLKLLDGKFQKGHLLSFNLHSVLSIVMKSVRILVCPCRSVEECVLEGLFHPFVEGILLDATPTLWYGGVVLQYAVVIIVLVVITLLWYPLRS